LGLSKGTDELDKARFAVIVGDGLPNPSAVNGIDIVIDREIRAHSVSKDLAECGKVKSDMRSPERRKGRYSIEFNLQ